MPSPSSSRRVDPSIDDEILMAKKLSQAVRVKVTSAMRDEAEAWSDHMVSYRETGGRKNPYWEFSSRGGDHKTRALAGGLCELAVAQYLKIPRQLPYESDDNLDLVAKTGHTIDVKGLVYNEYPTKYLYVNSIGRLKADSLALAMCWRRMEEVAIIGWIFSSAFKKQAKFIEGLEHRAVPHYQLWHPELLRMQVRYCEVCHAPNPSRTGLHTEKWYCSEHVPSR